MLIRLQHCGNEHGLFWCFLTNYFIGCLETRCHRLNKKGLFVSDASSTLAKATQFCSLSLVISDTVASTTAIGEHVRKYFMLINVRRLICIRDLLLCHPQNKMDSHTVRVRDI